MRFQVSSAERMANWRWTSTESAYGLLMCACMCLYLICSLCCPASFALTWNLSFKSPCFREDYISALKPAETAFLTLLQGKSRVRNKRKQSTLNVPIPWKWWQIEQRVNGMAGCLHWLLPSGHHRESLWCLINYSECGLSFLPTLFANSCFYK